jgi:hypothetical protein
MIVVQFRCNQLFSCSYLTLFVVSSFSLCNLNSIFMRHLIVIVFLLVTMLASAKQDLYLEVFPNPSSNQIVYVRTDKSCFYQLYDISGNQLQSGYLNDGVNQLSIRQAPGYYFLKADHKVLKVILQ